MSPRSGIHRAFTLLLVSLLVPASTLAYSKRQTQSEGFFDPSSNGGSMLTSVPETFPEGLGEPINIIISAKSGANILQEDLWDYFKSLDFSGECLGQHFGNRHQANLGDGKGYRNETDVLRYNFGTELGSCKQSLEGGNHFRYWVQDGDEANSGAIFIAASYEKSADENHDIVVDGYNFGRDLIVGNVTKSAVTVPSASSSFSGSTTSVSSNETVTSTYNTQVQYVEGLLFATNEGINHAGTVGIDGQPPIDGLVAVFTVTKISTDSLVSNISSSEPEESVTQNAATVHYSHMGVIITSLLLIHGLGLISLLLSH